MAVTVIMMDAYFSTCEDEECIVPSHAEMMNRDTTLHKISQDHQDNYNMPFEIYMAAPVYPNPTLPSFDDMNKAITAVFFHSYHYLFDLKSKVLVSAM